MAGKYNNKKKGAASYSGKWRKTSGKSGATRALKSGSKQDRQVLTHFTNNKTKGAVISQSNLTAQGGTHSSCIEVSMQLPPQDCTRPRFAQILPTKRARLVQIVPRCESYPY